MFPTNQLVLDVNFYDWPVITVCRTSAISQFAQFVLSAQQLPKVVQFVPSTPARCQRRFNGCRVCNFGIAYKSGPKLWKQPKSFISMHLIVEENIQSTIQIFSPGSKPEKPSFYSRRPVVQCNVVVWSGVQLSVLQCSP